MPQWAGGLFPVVVIILIFIALLIVPIRLGFSVRYLADVLDLRLVIGLFRPLLGSIPIPLLPIMSMLIQRSNNRRQSARKTQSESGSSESSTSGSSGFLKFASLFFSSIHSIDVLEWHTKVGSGDAATTSHLIGGLWAAKSTLVAWLRSRYQFASQPLYSTVPDYDSAGLALEVRCIFRFTIGEIIVALVKRSLPHGPRG